MEHTFRTRGGSVDVTLARSDDVWILGEHRATVESDGREDSSFQRNQRVCNGCQSRRLLVGTLQGSYLQF